MTDHNYKLHDTVTTPDGRGMVQGWLRTEGKPDQVLCSHAVKSNKHLVGRIRGIWYLAAYRPEELELYWKDG